GEVIEKGFSFLAGAETPDLYRLAVAVCQDDRARILAERYGLEFNGMQELPRGGEAFTFTCLVTGTTFLIHELADLEPKLRRIRAQFEPRKTGRDKCAE
ncbi:MAG TPA: hypothetical protein PKY95_12795, partial [candidate division Zixibacteria bacterium]|nr:hypothetical protein [candidate division Zixibacteria bacterium]